MAAEYATIEDVIRLGRKLTTEEQEKAAALLPVACAKLSTACKKYGKDLDLMIADEPDIELVAKDIIVRATLRAVDTCDFAGFTIGYGLLSINDISQRRTAAVFPQK